MHSKADVVSSPLRDKPRGTRHFSTNLCIPTQVEVTDTVGCGDSFAAAVVLGYINGASPVATLTLANAVGAATATGRGAGRNVATAAKVMSLLQGAAASEQKSMGELSEDRQDVPSALQMLVASIAQPVAA